MKIDLKKYNTKSLLLNFLTTQLDEMYSPNYDALIDSLSLYEGKITFNNSSNYTDLENFLEIIEIIKNENTKINIIIN